MAYQSPIDLIMTEWQTTFEDNTVKAVQHYGFAVDKDELKKALIYDRGQYDKGYSDGRFDAIRDLLRCKDCKHFTVQNGESLCGAWEEIFYNPVEENGYCYKGERKEE